jgi:hypothetical protein
MTPATGTGARAQVRERRARERKRAEHRAGRTIELIWVRVFGVQIAYWWVVSIDPNLAINLLMAVRHSWTPPQQAAVRQALVREEESPALILTPPMLFAATRWYCGLRIPDSEAELFAEPALATRR